MDYFSFTETVRFERNAEKLLDDAELGKIQLFLCEFPNHGKAIAGSGGIRKMRWGVTGRGKRGGTRIIYFVAVSQYRILLAGYLRKE